jgi:AcrR family transcriptional regulator
MKALARASAYRGRGYRCRRLPPDPTKLADGHSQRESERLPSPAAVSIQRWGFNEVARTQAADYEQRREAIVEKAADLFARTGFRGASVSDLAAACETSKSLLYHYYPSKEDVLYAVMASHIDQLVEDVLEASGRDATARDRLVALIHAFMRHYVGAAARQKVLLNELDNLPAERRSAIVAKQRQVVDAVQGLLEELDPALTAVKGRSRVKTMLLFGMINWTHTWFDAAGPMSADEIADMALAMILGDPERDERKARRRQAS